MSNAESKHDPSAKSLLHNVVQSHRIEIASSCLLDEQSNSSSLESTKSFALDGIQALSTSCSEDSFEISCTTSKPTAEVPSQLSLQDLNLTSNAQGPENLAQRPNISLDCKDGKSSECNSSDQMSRDSLEPSNLLRKFSSQKNGSFPTTRNSQILTSYQFDHYDKPNDGEISWYEAAASGTVVRNGARTTESWSMESRNFTGNDKASLREYIDKELHNLDTCLPQLDFNKLAEKLKSAAKERTVTERKLLGEQVRRRLALQVGRHTTDPAPRISMRPSKSHIGLRLPTAMNLQICYINDVKDDEEQSSDEDFYLPKSMSAPNLRSCVMDGSYLNASQLRQALSAMRGKRYVLEEETKMMLAKAKQAARMQMEIERLHTDRFTTALPPKASRLQLSKMTCQQLTEMSERIRKRINEENTELMRLLVEKDSLYMHQDSILVDIEDMIQHESNSESLNLPDFLKVQATSSVIMSKFHVFND